MKHVVHIHNLPSLYETSIKLQVLPVEKLWRQKPPRRSTLFQKEENKQVSISVPHHHPQSHRANYNIYYLFIYLFIYLFTDT